MDQIKKEGITLRKQQQCALDALKRGENVFLSGDAGTGKSYVINQFIEWLKANGKKVAICAPTGLAALAIGGVTLHRTFGFPIGPIKSLGKTKYIETADVIIIDEISMCRVDLFKSIANTLFRFQQQSDLTDSEKGVVRKKQVVLSGDFFQLPPIVTKQDQSYLGITTNEAYAFCCPEWDAFHFNSIVLDEVVRQDDVDFVENLNKLRMGDASSFSYFTRNCNPNPIDKAIHLCGKNASADMINEKNLAQLKDKEYTYYADIEGDVKPSDMSTLPVLKLKKHARVMALTNLVGGARNGMIGEIIALNKNEVCVKFDNGEKVYFEPITWEIKGYSEGSQSGEMETVGTFTQMPLKLAYAITIHKSQGQTYNAVNLDPVCFSEGQLYVGMSRCRSLQAMHLTSSLKKSYLKTSKTVFDFYAGLKKQGASIQQDNVVESKREVISLTYRTGKEQLSLFG